MKCSHQIVVHNIYSFSHNTIANKVQQCRTYQPAYFQQPVLLCRYCSHWASTTWIVNRKIFLGQLCFDSLHLLLDSGPYFTLCSVFKPYSIIYQWNVFSSVEQSKDQSNQISECVFVWKLDIIQIKCTLCLWERVCDDTK